MVYLYRDDESFTDVIAKSIREGEIENEMEKGFGSAGAKIGAVGGATLGPLGALGGAIAGGAVGSVADATVNAGSKLIHGSSEKANGGQAEMCKSKEHQEAIFRANIDLIRGNPSPCEKSSMVDPDANKPPKTGTAY